MQSSRSRADAATVAASRQKASTAGGSSVISHVLCLALLMALPGQAPFPGASAKLVAGAVEVTPPVVYARWYADLERCTGRRGTFDELRWFVVPRWTLVPGRHVFGRALPNHRIVLAAGMESQEWLVKHEMLHDLLGDSSPQNPLFAALVSPSPCLAATVPPAQAPPLSAVSLG
jgi:hypothetical protein